MADFGREMEEADPDFVRGYVKASDPAGNELGMLAALVADPVAAGRGAQQYGIWQDRVGREVAGPGGRRPSPASPRMGSGWPSCSAWVRLRRAAGTGSPTFVGHGRTYWIDWSVNRLGWHSVV